jgi:hypothetical protein
VRCIRHSTVIRNGSPRIWQRLLRTGSCNILIGKLGSQTIDDFDQELCLGNRHAKRSYVVYGNSFAAGAYLVFREAYPEIIFSQLTIPGCRILPTKRIANSDYAALFRAVLEDLKVLEQQASVIVASNWADPDFDEIEALITTFKARGLDVVIVGQRIRFDTGLPAIMLSSLSKDQAWISANVRLLAQQPRLNARLQKRFSTLAKFINMIGLQCPVDRDIFTEDNSIVYLDDAHPSIAGVALVAHRLRAAYPDLFDNT